MENFNLYEVSFNSIVEALPNSLLLVNKSGNIVYVNSYAEKLFLYTKEELIGKELEILLPERYRNQHVSFTAMFFANPHLKAMGTGRDLFALRKNGTEFSVEIGLNPMTIENEILILVSIVDITQRKKVEEVLKENSIKLEMQNNELIQSAQKLRELNVTKDKLFSIIGHDLRGPIGGFKTLLELLVTDVDLADKEYLKEILKVLQKSANATHEMLENLLAWAQTQHKEVVFAPEKIDLNKMVLRIMDLFNELTLNKQIRIINNVPEKVMVYADQNMLMSVLRNLISNAIKFTPNGKQIKVFVDQNQKEYIITIKDEGTGIKPEDLPKLFKDTINFTTHGTSGEKGSGLGLLLCHEFIKKHNGKIWVESELGVGSEFKFTLPLKNE